MTRRNFQRIKNASRAHLDQAVLKEHRARVLSQPLPEKYKAPTFPDGSLGSWYLPDSDAKEPSAIEVGVPLGALALVAAAGISFGGCSQAPEKEEPDNQTTIEAVAREENFSAVVNKRYDSSKGKRPDHTGPGSQPNRSAQDVADYINSNLKIVRDGIINMDGSPTFVEVDVNYPQDLSPFQSDKNFVLLQRGIEIVGGKTNSEDFGYFVRYVQKGWLDNLLTDNATEFYEMVKPYLDEKRVTMQSLSRISDAAYTLQVAKENGQFSEKSFELMKYAQSNLHVRKSELHDFKGFIGQSRFERVYSNPEVQAQLKSQRVKQIADFYMASFESSESDEGGLFAEGSLSLVKLANNRGLELLHYFAYDLGVSDIGKRNDGNPWTMPNCIILSDFAELAENDGMEFMEYLQNRGFEWRPNWMREHQMEVLTKMAKAGGRELIENVERSIQGFNFRGTMGDLEDLLIYKKAGTLDLIDQARKAGTIDTVYAVDMDGLGYAINGGVFDKPQGPLLMYEKPEDIPEPPKQLLTGEEAKKTVLTEKAMKYFRLTGNTILWVSKNKDALKDEKTMDMVKTVYAEKGQISAHDMGIVDMLANNDSIRMLYTNRQALEQHYYGVCGREIDHVSPRRPDATELTNFDLLRVYLLDQTMKQGANQKFLGNLIWSDIHEYKNGAEKPFYPTELTFDIFADKTGLSMDAETPDFQAEIGRLTAGGFLETRSKRNERAHPPNFRQKGKYFQAYAGHSHATKGEDSSEGAAPSGSYAAVNGFKIEHDMKAAQDSTGVVITPLGREGPDKIRVNVDMYWVDGMTNKGKSVDMGTYIVPYQKAEAKEK